jgi:hypothetical protein
MQRETIRYAVRCRWRDVLELVLELVVELGSGFMAIVHICDEGNPGKTLLGNPGKTLLGNPGKTLLGNPGKTLRGNPGKTLLGNPGKTLRGNPGKTLRGNPGKTLRGNPGKTLQTRQGIWASGCSRHCPAHRPPPSSLLPPPHAMDLLANLYVFSFFSSSSSTHTDLNHRRLSDGPGFVDFVVVVGLAILLFYMLRVLRRISDNWKQMMKDRITKAMEKRKLVKDPFRTNNGYSWDYVMVFKVHVSEAHLSKVQKEKNLKFIIQRLSDAGLQTKLFFSVQNDEIYLKIRAPYSRLLKEADRMNYKLCLEPTQLANVLRIGNMVGPVEKQWKPVEVPFTHPDTNLSPYDFIYCDFRPELHEKDLYKKWPNGNIFRGVDRLKLIAGIIAARQSEGGCDLDVYRLIRDRCMIAFFPLHDAGESEGAMYIHSVYNTDIHAYIMFQWSCGNWRKSGCA